MNNTIFRKKIFKGAGIEDLYQYCELSRVENEKLSSEHLEKVLNGEAASHYLSEYHRGMAVMAQQIKLQIVHQFKYEEKEDD